MLAACCFAALIGCTSDDETARDRLHIDISDCEDPSDNQAARCWCTDCRGISPDPFDNPPCVIHDQEQVEIKNNEDVVIGYVTLYYSLECGAVWGTTLAASGVQPTQIASFLFDAPDADGQLLPQGWENVNTLGDANVWSTAMQPAKPGVVACGWLEIPNDEGNPERFGSCTHGNGEYINHPPVCTGLEIYPGEFVPSDDGMHTQQYLDIQGIYDPDGDAFETTIESIFQSQEVDANGDGETCPDASKEDGWVRLERQGLSPLCRRYAISVSATDGHGATCDPHGHSAVDVAHDNRRFYSEASPDPFETCSRMDEPEVWYESTVFCPPQ